MKIELPMSPPKSWPVLSKRIDALNLTVGESLFLSKSILETALWGVEQDLRQLMLEGFIRAIRLERPL